MFHSRHNLLRASTSRMVLWSWVYLLLQVVAWAQAPKVPTTDPVKDAAPRSEKGASVNEKGTIVDDGIPAFHLARLQLTGQVQNERALITAEVDVDVNRDQGGYHDVSLRFQQAHFLKKEYSGPGREGPVLDVPVEEGIVWRFSGYGTHHLKLTMWVPIKESPAGRQLVLSLPTMPQGFDAQIDLTIPGTPVVFRGSRELTILSSTAENQQNRILADIRGPRLDLTWSEPPDVQTAYRQVTSSFSLHRDNDRVMVLTEQVLIPENSGIRAADVKLPEGFELEDVTGGLLKSHEPLPNRPGWHRLTFGDGVAERIELNWILTAPFASDGGTLAFDGLTVADARNQSGRIRLQEFPGYQLVPRPGQFVRRAPASQPQVAEVFEYTKQPFRIEWAIQKIMAKYSTRLRSVLNVTTSQITLDQRYQFQIDAGSMESVELVWPEAANQGWRLDTARLSPELFVAAEDDRLNRDGQLRLHWKAPKSGTAELELRFIRPLDSTSSASQVSLPALSGSRVLTSDFLIAAEDQLEVTAQDASGNPFPPTTVDSAKLSDLSPQLLSQIRQQLPPLTGNSVVNLSWKSQSRSIEAETEIELRRASSGRIRVQQTVIIRVRYGRLDNIRLEVPKNLEQLLVPSNVAFGGSVDGAAVLPQIQGATLLVPFPESRIGDVRVTVDYSFPAGQTASTIPILKLSGTNFQFSRVRIPEGESLRVLPTAKDWQPVPTAPDALVWIGPSVTEIPLLLESDQSASPRFSIDQAFYRTRFDAQGRIECVCEFHWPGGVRTFPLTLPSKSELLAVRCNGANLSASARQIQIDPKQPEQITIRLPAVNSQTHLAVMYRMTGEAGFQQRDLRAVRLPVLPSDASVVHSYWELELPAGRHLFIGPSDLTAEHSWRRGGLFWSRVPLPSYGQLRANGFKEASSITTIADVSNIYAYSSIGRIESVRFQSMSRTLILLLGAGLTLSMGFLFWNLPATRNMLTLLIVFFGFSLLSLWFLEPIQLLLQPAILGIVLAVVATVIDLRSRRSTTMFIPVTTLLAKPGVTDPSSGMPLELPSPPSRGSSAVRATPNPMPQTAVYSPSEIRGS